MCLLAWLGSLCRIAVPSKGTLAIYLCRLYNKNQSNSFFITLIEIISIIKCIP